MKAFPLIVSNLVLSTLIDFTISKSGQKNVQIFWPVLLFVCSVIISSSKTLKGASIASILFIGVIFILKKTWNIQSIVLLLILFHAAEVLHNLFTRVITKNEKHEKNWKTMQRAQVREAFVKYVSLRFRDFDPVYRLGDKSIEEE